MRTRAALALALAAATATIVLAACVTAPPPQSPAPDARRVATGTPIPRSVLGLRERGGGKVSATGRARFVDLEGGFWVVEFPEQRFRGMETTHVVLVFPGDEAQQERSWPHNGQDVHIVGRMEPTGTASVRMAGPELVVESVGVRID